MIKRWVEAAGRTQHPLSVTGPGLRWHTVGGRIWSGLCKDQDVYMFPASGNNVLSYYFMHRGMETFFLCFSLPPSSFPSMIQTPLTVWSWWLADFPNVVRTSFPSAFSPSPAPAEQHNNAPSCPFHLFPFPIPALPHSFQDYSLCNSSLCLSLTWWTHAYTPYSVPPHPCTDAQASPRLSPHSTSV